MTIEYDDPLTGEPVSEPHDWYEQMRSDVRDADHALRSIQHNAEHLDDFTLEDCAELLVDLQAAKDIVAATRREVDRRFSELAPKNDVTIEPFGSFSVQRGWSRKFDAAGIVRNLAVRIGDAPEVWYDPDGERLPPTVSATRILERALEVIPATGSTQFRVGKADGSSGMRKFGLDPDQFVESKERTLYVRVPRPKDWDAKEIAARSHDDAAS